MKKFLALILASFMLFAFTACGDNSTPAGEGENNTSVSEATDKKEPAKKNYPDNILMEDVHYINRSSPVLGNEAVTRSDIQTVTFKDTLEGMPADAWDVSDTKNGSVMAWVVDGVHLYIAGNGGVTAKNCQRLFLYYQNVVSIDFGGCFYTDISKGFSEMFTYCQKLETLDLSTWNMSNAEGISCMFENCFKLKSVNLSGWDTSNMIGMVRTFDSCKNLEAIDVSHFDTSKVISFESMFYGCEKLSALDVSTWNTSSAKKMTSMFNACNNLTSLDLSGWDTSKVESMYGMFGYCTKLASIGDFKIPEGCNTEDCFIGTPLA